MSVETPDFGKQPVPDWVESPNSFALPHTQRYRKPRRAGAMAIATQALVAASGLDAKDGATWVTQLDSQGNSVTTNGRGGVEFGSIENHEYHAMALSVRRKIELLGQAQALAVHIAENATGIQVCPKRNPEGFCVSYEYPSAFSEAMVYFHQLAEMTRGNYQIDTVPTVNPGLKPDTPENIVTVSDIPNGKSFLEGFLHHLLIALKKRMAECDQVKDQSMVRINYNMSLFHQMQDTSLLNDVQQLKDTTSSDTPDIAQVAISNRAVFGPELRMGMQKNMLHPRDDTQDTIHFNMQ